MRHRIVVVQESDLVFAFSRKPYPQLRMGIPRWPTRLASAPCFARMLNTHHPLQSLVLYGYAGIDFKSAQRPQAWFHHA